MTEETKLFSTDRTAVYIRASDQTDVHEKELRQYCESNGWTIDYDFVDDGVYSKAIDRPMFGSMMNFVHSYLFKRIIAIKLEHVAHSVGSFVEWVNELREYDCRLILLEEEFDSSTPESEHALTMFAAMAEAEMNQAHERKMEKRRRTAIRGGNTGKPAPYGYRFEDGQYVVDDVQAEIVINVFSDYVDNDGLSMAAIARNLNDSNLHTSRGGKWQTATIRYILRNGFYAGLVQYEGREVEGKHEAIVSVELYRKAQAKVERTARPRALKT